MAPNSAKKQKLRDSASKTLELRGHKSRIGLGGSLSCFSIAWRRRAEGLTSTGAKSAPCLNLGRRQGWLLGIFGYLELLDIWSNSEGKLHWSRSQKSKSCLSNPLEWPWTAAAGELSSVLPFPCGEDQPIPGFVQGKRCPASSQGKNFGYLLAGSALEVWE